MLRHSVDRQCTRICAFIAISMHPTELRDRRGCPNNPAWSTRVSDTHMQCAYGTAYRKPSNTNPLYASDGHSYYSARGREKRTGFLNNLSLSQRDDGNWTWVASFIFRKNQYIDYNYRLITIQNIVSFIVDSRCDDEKQLTAASRFLLIASNSRNK